MCGYDPFYWYERQLDREYAAYQAGFESVDNAKQDNRDNDTYDELYN